MSSKYREMKLRRKELMAQMETNSIALLASAPPRTRNSDAEYQYRQSSDFYYLSGFTEKDALLALIPGRKQGEVVLFCQEKNKDKELWTGRLMGPELACKELEVDDAFPISDIDDILPGLIEGRDRVYYSMGKDHQFDNRVMDWVNVIRNKANLGAHPPGEFLMLDHFLHELRLIKSPGEIKLMEQAAKISAVGHKRAMAACKPGVMEYELEAELLYAFAQGGARSPAYVSIVGAGENACILHYDSNDAEVKEGDLILIDAGAEFDHYASDITRTFPATGKFSAEQKALYEIVLKAHNAAVDEVQPGASWDAPHNASVKIITKGLIKLGLLKGTPAQLIKQEAYKEFYMHRVGHWIGLDVHDVGDYKIDDHWRLLEAGMVTTIEPGIYISPDNTSVSKKWRGIGIRIEDDVLVTKKGSRILSKGIPTTVDEIESFMAQSVH
ncbi:MAG: Xaa-Pro aminopeptidase [Gammaproteobacteria bacterium]|jgi:Xaa-Pro aminopeptidase|nr:Xaa-Pro aminopeptidase [Gammaproteobacteria bacterium]MBT3860101.1 Xaa-Pro aminopeptidase [Gammaproteobacteria bacterium]MBT3987393.1 Xaa-Pro aminopeptidase [Gammaproteobacteria bacterium]MBT4256546.1 Xaa-Pro aminopeptidase [Gammaproteobacteria bacterium]MBT4581869.1 Xaa-Pro aminopeptidase [Gammaproteobacteria bacterium]